MYFTFHCKIYFQLWTYNMMYLETPSPGLRDQNNLSTKIIADRIIFLIVLTSVEKIINLLLH